MDEMGEVVAREALPDNDHGRAERAELVDPSWPIGIEVGRGLRISARAVRPGAVATDQRSELRPSSMARRSSFRSSREASSSSSSAVASSAAPSSGSSSEGSSSAA